MPADNGDHYAIDSDGKALPYSPEQVRAIVEKAVRNGRLVLAVVTDEDGNLCCHVEGPPSSDTADTLETVARAYRAGLRGH